MTQFDPSGGTDPLAGFTAQLEQLKAKAEHVQETIRTASATASSPDGAVRVTVGPAGTLLKISFNNRAYARPPESLGSLVLQLIGTAQKQVSVQVAGVFGELVGEDSPAMEVLEEFMPPQEDSDEAPAGPEPTPASTAPPPPARKPPVRPPADEDDDFSNPW